MEEGCIVIQTCDKYQCAWEGLFWSMNKYWDFTIPWTIYFCNEELDVSLPNQKYKQIKTGRISHCEMMKSIMQKIECDYIFYMLEDFWPIKHMSKEMFMGLFNIFKENNWDSLKVTPHQPNHYELEGTSFSFNNQKILKYSKNSKWKFNQQASFWKREVFNGIISPPKEEHAEGKHNTSLGVEIAMDEKFQKENPNAEVYLFNYLWYPVGGSIWRGKLTQIGEQIEFERQVDEYIKIKYC